MDCAEVEELIDAHALGALEPEEGLAIEAHVRDCPRCAESLAEARSVAEKLALVSPLNPPRPGLRREILARMAPVGYEVSRWSAAARAVPRWALASAAAIVIAVLVGALGWIFMLQNQVNDLKGNNKLLLSERPLVGEYSPDNRSLIQAVVSSPNVVVTEMRAGDMLGDSNAKVIGRYYWSSSQQMGVLLARGLPKLPEGQTYQMWLWHADQVVDGGTFNVGDDGMVSHLVLIPRGRGPFSRLGVSIEPGGGSPQRTGNIVLIGETSSHPEGD